MTVRYREVEQPRQWTRTLAVCGLVFVLTATSELVIVDAYRDDVARKNVYTTDMSPAVGGEDIRLGQARLAAEIGFVHMDLEELSAYLLKEISYQPDIYEYQKWKLPSVFVAEHGGDCEDYVLFALAVLDHSRYELKPVLGSYDGESHAFLLIRDSGSVYVLDTGGVSHIDSRAYDDLTQLPEPFGVKTVLDDMLHDTSPLGALL